MDSRHLDEREAMINSLEDEDEEEDRLNEDDDEEELKREEEEHEDIYSDDMSGWR
jgi:hypothetical protein